MYGNDRGYGNRPNRNFEQRSFAPVKEGEELDVKLNQQPRPGNRHPLP